MGFIDVIKKAFQSVGMELTTERQEKVNARMKGTDEQAATKAAKQVIKNEKERQRRQRNRAALKENGLSDTIISKYRLDTKNYDKYEKTDLQKYRRQSRERERMDAKKAAIEKTGAKPKKSDLRKSWAKLEKEFKLENPTKPKPTPKKEEWDIVREHLYIGLADNGSPFDSSEFDGYSIEELEEEIEQYLDYANSFPDDSAMWAGSWFVDYGSRATMDKRAEVMYDRGYSLNKDYMKLDQNSYNKLTVSNKWSKREFLKMTATIYSHMKSSDILHTHKKLKNYLARNGLDYFKKL